jgi:hypothetical protein
MKTVLSLLVLAAVICSGSSCRAKELADPASGCSLTIPDNWEIIPFKQEGGYSVASRSPDKTEGISLFVTPTPAKTIDDATDYINGFKNYLQAQKATITSSGKETLGGNTFYVITTTPGGVTTSLTMTSWITVANGKIYQVGLTEADPNKAGDLISAFQTFSIRK